MTNPSRKFSELIAFTAIITSIFAVIISNNHLGIPAYGRISLLVIAFYKLLPALQMWLSASKPETNRKGQIAVKVNLTSSPLQRAAGIERCFHSFILLYVACYAPQLTFVLLKMQFWKVLAIEGTNMWSHSSGKNRLLQTVLDSVDDGLLLEVAMVCIPLLYAYWRGDI